MLALLYLGADLGGMVQMILVSEGGERVSGRGIDGTECLLVDR